MFDKFIAAFIGAKLGKLAEFEPMSKHTTLRVGGPARLFVQPADKDALINIIDLAKSLSIQFKLLGKGSNLLASDELFNGVIIQLDKTLTYTKIDNNLVHVGAGTSDVKLSLEVAKMGLTGLEFLSGIPGTIGGAVFMNAGAYKKQMSDVLTKVQIINSENELLWLNVEELELGYRSSIFQKHPDWVIVEAVLRLEPGNTEDILELMNSRKQKRKESQPLDFPSAGSAFRNPKGHFSWQLISEAGLRGYCVGGAKVSEKHANFVINTGNATSKNVADIIFHVKSVVKEKSGLELHPEVEFFNWS